MIAIADYGMGNLRSVYNAFLSLGGEPAVTKDPAVLLNASHVVLPGVGAFAQAKERLDACGFTDVLLKCVDGGKPFLGICLGMQLLLERSYEHGVTEGLGVIPGEVVPFKLNGLKVPHMGWNDVQVNPNPLMTGGYVYFVHSFHANGVPEENVMARTTYGYPFVSAVMKGNVYATQFHPEKSGEVGLEILKNFMRLK